ncbi:NUDIX hydrolase [Bacillus testis]|uniref:NUDIX hydrolase n=1 Tax=Bacillus testis TaxID=1622072 RepID=UPI00067EE2B5|nr:NUDIX hydrolase [Bacillus testis]
MSDKWIDWARRIQSVGQSGLAFSKDIFDRERYEELLNISAEMMADHSGLEVDAIKAMFAEESGYQTPKVDVRGVAFREGKILLVKEKMDDRWALPGGFGDVGLSPSENVTKELKEETGYDVEPVKLLAVLDSNKYPLQRQPFHYYKLFIQCKIVGGHAEKGIETKGIAFFGEDELPPLSYRRNTETQLRLMFEFDRNPDKQAAID